MVNVCYLFLLVKKVRNQTSDNTDRWKAEMGRGRQEERREAKRREDQRRESPTKEDPGARKGRKVAKHCVFPCFSNVLWPLRAGGSKSRLAKERWRAIWPDERWTFARGAKHMWKSKCTRHSMLGPLLESAVRKCRPLWRKAHVQVKSVKLYTQYFGTLLEVQISKKRASLRRKAHVGAKMLKTLHAWTTF